MCFLVWWPRESLGGGVHNEKVVVLKEREEAAKISRQAAPLFPKGLG